MNRVLVVDDDEQIRAAVAGALERFDFDIKTVESADEAQLAVGSFEPDIILLDIMMPGMSGIEFCRQLRQTKDIPVIFLSGLDTEVDRIVGLEIGADDYLTKPFHPGELLARIKAVLRRTAPKTEPAPKESNGSMLEHGPLSMNLDSHTVHVHEERIDLTKTEFLLLKTMMRYPSKVYSRDELMSSAHGPGTHVSDRTINSHIRRLRSKLEVAGVDPIETVRGVGYRMSIME